MLDPPRQDGKWPSRIAYGILILNALLCLALLLAQDSVWNPNMPDRERWLRKFLFLFAIVIGLYTYCVLAVIRGKWLHGLYVYGGLTVIFAWQEKWLSYPVFYILPLLSLIGIEVLTVCFASSVSKNWGRQFSRARCVILPSCLATGIMLTLCLQNNPERQALWWLLWALINNYAFNLLNLVVARLIQNRGSLWCYSCGAAEGVLVIFVSLAMAAIGGLG